MNFIPLTAELFISGTYEYREEAFDMQPLLNGDDLIGGVSPNPALPNVVSLDLLSPLMELHMFTNNLSELAAPRELCVRKALELIGSRANFELNIAAFRMELLSQILAEPCRDDVDALVQGVRCICEYLMSNFDNYMHDSVEFFPYEFYQLHRDRYLFLVKITFDANIPDIRPATLVQPAYDTSLRYTGHLSQPTYPSMQECYRADYFAQADQCIIL